MRPFLTAVSFLTLFLVASCSTFEVAGQPPEADRTVSLKSITVEPSATGSVIKVFASRNFEFSSYLLTNPNRIAIEIINVTDDKIEGITTEPNELISAAALVRSAKPNSLRLEFALTNEAKYSFSQKADHLEIFVFRPTLATVRGADDEAESLTAKYEKLRAENSELKKRLVESAKQLEEANKLSAVLKSRVEYVEKQLDEIERKLNRTGSSPKPGPDDVFK